VWPSPRACTDPRAAPALDLDDDGQTNAFEFTAGRTYAVQYKLSLSDPTWQTLTGATVSDNGTTRTVTDPSGSGAAKFYRVQVSKP
jgi:hypothetical protein